MIERVELTNFQIHKYLVIDFDREVTTIVGRSDGGKSAILRAIRWVCLNLPAGNDFKRVGAKTVSVKLTIDGTVVERSQEGSSNLYRIGKDEWTAFGRDVPEPVADFLRISNLNFQRQHDAPFWFSETAGEVSRELNRIVDLELVDTTLKALDSSLRSSRMISQGMLEKVNHLREARKELRFVPSLCQDLKNTRSRAGQATEVQSQVSGLRASLNVLGAASASLAMSEGALKDGKAVLILGKRTVDVSRSRKALESAIDEIRETDGWASAEVPNLIPLSKLQAVIIKKGKRRAKLKTQIWDIKRWEDQIVDGETSLSETRVELLEFNDGRCPLCQQLLK